MTLLSPLPFAQIWAVDFEYSQPGGDTPDPLCMVACELRTGRAIKMWRDELRSSSRPPFSTGAETLLLAYYASAEMNCFLELGWPTPEYLLDLYAEFRCHTNGFSLPCGKGLVGALTYFGLDAMDVTEKDAMRQLAMRGGQYTTEEQKALIDYCTTDVVALEKLLPCMLPAIDIPRALLRGRYMISAARMERAGIPIDTVSLNTLLEFWPEIQEELVHRIDEGYGVFDGTSFRRERFERYLIAQDIPWPRHPDSGVLRLDDDTFKGMAQAFPQLNPLRELRVTLSQMRKSSLEIGGDGRNRTLLSAFSSKTSRNQPRSSKFIFGPSAWLRSLIKPTEGCGIAYIDYAQQEFMIAAVLSGDQNMITAYESGDPYMTFAIQAGAAPPGATKQTHGEVRNRFKTTALAVQYGAGVGLIASRTGLDEAYARELLKLHQRVYSRYWEWTESVLNYGSLRGHLDTIFGWRLHVTPDPRQKLGPNPRSLVNFPVQANGAEMLRLACIFATESGVKVCAPIHDALLIEAPLGNLQDAVKTARGAMSDASKIVLGDFEVRTDVEEIHYPDRYMDGRGEKMWKTVWGIIQERQL